MKIDMSDNPEINRPARRNANRAFRLRVAAGLVFWVASVAGVWILHEEFDAESEISGRIIRHLTRDAPVFEASFPVDTTVGAKNVVRIDTKGGLLAAGHVISVDETETGRQAVVAIYPEYSHRVSDASRLYSARTSKELGWVLNTLLPEARLEEIREILRKRWEERKEELLRELEPGLLHFVDDVVETLRDDFPRVVEQHRADFKVIGTVLHERAWKQNFQGVFIGEVWPVIEERSLPLLRTIGDEIVDEFPVWAMSWAYVVQTLPFTDNDKVAARIRGFIKEKALPIVRGYGSDFRSMATGVLRDTFGNDAALTSLENAAAEVAADPRFRAAMWSIFKSWIIENPKFAGLLAGTWERPDIRQPVERFLEAFEPDVRKIGNLLLLNDDGDGINPDLARVLRRKLLKEDESWVLLELNEDHGGRSTTTLVGLDGGIR